MISLSCLSFIFGVREASMTGIYSFNHSDSLKWLFLPVWHHMTSSTTAKYNKLWQWVQLLVLSASLLPGRHLEVSLLSLWSSATKTNMIHTANRSTKIPSQRHSLICHANHTATRVHQHWGRKLAQSFFFVWSTCKCVLILLMLLILDEDLVKVR